MTIAAAVAWRCRNARRSSLADPLPDRGPHVIERKQEHRTDRQIARVVELGPIAADERQEPGGQKDNHHVSQPHGPGFFRKRKSIYEDQQRRPPGQVGDSPPHRPTLWQAAAQPLGFGTCTVPPRSQVNCQASHSFDAQYSPPLSPYLPLSKSPSLPDVTIRSSGVLVGGIPGTAGIGACAIEGSNG